MDELADRAVAMARAVPEDPFCGLAEPASLAGEPPALDLADEGEPSGERLFERANQAESAARDVNGVTNSEGAEAGWGRSTIALANSAGFTGAYSRTRFSVSASVLAGEGTEMERDYDYALACHEADLDAADAVGERAGTRAVKRLGPRKVTSAKLSVVYDPRVALGLLRHFSQAISGQAVARGTSFLKDELGKPVFAPTVDVIDDPHRRRGLRSHPFDGEGVGPRRSRLVEDGMLISWLLESRSARQLGLTTTGHAARGPSSPPSPAPANLFISPGTRSPAEMIADIESGLYVTELMGMGINPVNGDYSRGAAGFWIEKGEIAYPVSEITIAGNLKEMFRALEPADDLEFRYGIDAPTVRIDGMTVAGR